MRVQSCEYSSPYAAPKSPPWPFSRFFAPLFVSQAASRTSLAVTTVALSLAALAHSFPGSATAATACALAAAGSVTIKCASTGPFVTVSCFWWSRSWIWSTVTGASGTLRPTRFCSFRAALCALFSFFSFLARFHSSSNKESSSLSEEELSRTFFFFESAPLRPFILLFLAGNRKKRTNFFSSP